jgi:hypothetical protein
MPAAASALVFTAPPAGLRASRSLTAALAALGLDAQDASLFTQANRVLGAEVADLGAHGDAGGLTSARRVVAAAAALSAVGAPAGMAPTRHLIGQVGTLRVHGDDATLFSGGHLPLAADAGSLGIHGNDALVRRHARLTAALAQLSALGAPAALTRGRSLIAEPGTLGAHANAANLATTRRLVALLGALQLTGRPALLIYSAEPVVITEFMAAVVSLYTDFNATVVGLSFTDFDAVVVSP